MDNHYYPDIEGAWLLPLKVAFEGLRGDPLWLERKGCPYEEEVVEALRELWGMVRNSASAGAPEQKERPERAPLGEDRWERLGQDAEALFQDLMAYKDDLDGIDDEGKAMKPSDRLAFYRTAAQLLDKLLTLGERAKNLKQVSDFQNRVLAVFEEVLTPEQRTRALTMMGEVRRRSSRSRTTSAFSPPPTSAT